MGLSGSARKYRPFRTFSSGLNPVPSREESHAGASDLSLSVCWRNVPATSELRFGSRISLMMSKGSWRICMAFCDVWAGRRGLRWLKCPFQEGEQDCVRAFLYRRLIIRSTAKVPRFGRFRAMNIYIPWERLCWKVLFSFRLHDL